MIEERDKLREQNPADPRIDTLNTDIKHSIDQHKREKDVAQAAASNLTR